MRILPALALAVPLAIALPAGPAAAAAVGSTTLVSVTMSGKAAQGRSSDAVMTPDGRYVAFSSDAPGLVPDQRHVLPDVYRRDMVTGETVRVSVPLPGTQLHGSKGSTAPAISADGNVIAFVSDVGHLVPGVPSGRTHLYVRDLRAGTTVLVDRSDSGEPGDGWDGVGTPSISSDGRRIAFAGYSDNLPGGNSRKGRVYVHDLGITHLRPVSPPPVSRDWVYDATMSADGSTVAFSSEGRSWAGKGFDWKDQVFVVDVRTGAVEQVTRAPGGEGGNDPSRGASLSADGRLVAFTTYATNLHLGPGTTSTMRQVVLYDRRAGSYALVSARPDGQASATGSSQGAFLSADGTTVVFSSSAHDLVGGEDEHVRYEAFARDLRAGTTRLVGVDSSGRQPAGLGGAAYPSSISADGSVVAFVATGLLPARNPDLMNVYVRRTR